MQLWQRKKPKRMNGYRKKLKKLGIKLLKGLKEIQKKLFKKINWIL